ncbi:ATP-dependent Clp protease ATP-binding subunit [Patescibacteria group bacterium]|nr:ATP-dependent Clp protease ATP-binding subunit [Patescibacteria group bacterium]
MKEQIYFNHKKAQFWPHARLVRLVRTRVFSIPLVVFVYGYGTLSILYFLIYFIRLIPDIPILSDIPFSNTMTGYASIGIALSFLLASLHIYYKAYVEQPAPKFTAEQVTEIIQKGGRVNLADFASVPVLLTIDLAFKRSHATQKGFIEAREIYVAMTKEDRGRFIINRLGFFRDDFIKEMDAYYKSQGKNYVSEIDVTYLFAKALEVAAIEKHPKILVSDILAALSEIEPFMQELLFSRNIKVEDVLNIVYWQTTNEIYDQEKKFDPDNPKLTGGIGKDWSMGYALALNQFAYDMTEIVARQQTPIHLIGRSRETQEMEKILVRASKHNVLLVGPSGVGKSSIALNFARRVLYGQTYPALANRKIMQLNIDYILAGAETPGAIIERLSAVLNDAVRAGNIVLYMNNIQSLFAGGGSKVGAVDASDVLIPYLENPELYFVATTTTSAYHQYIESKTGVADKFERIDVEEPDYSATIRILEDILHWLEPAYKVTVTYNALQKIVELSDRFIYNKYFPEKAIDLLNELVVFVKSQGRDIIFPEDVEQTIQMKTKVPIGEGETVEKERLLNLEDYLHKRVIGQNTAINAVANALRRARAGIRSGHKPIGSFLFLGPTGVGKTETSKALADSYFGSEDKMIRFDMSEYQDISGLHRLLGAPPGTPQAESGGQLTNAVRDNPFSLILFDEIEKAEPNILNIFLQLLDEGWVTDSLGRKVKFNNSIIIATSNAGAEYLRQLIQEGTPEDEIRDKLLNYLQEQHLFRPEFLNRFTAVVNFNPLTTDQIVTITHMMVEKLISRLDEEKGIFLTVTEPAVQKLAELGYDPQLGARPIQRVLQEKVENFLAKKMLSEEIKRGSSLTFDVDDIE